MLFVSSYQLATNTRTREIVIGVLQTFLLFVSHTRILHGFVPFVLCKISCLAYPQLWNTFHRAVVLYVQFPKKEYHTPSQGPRR